VATVALLRLQPSTGTLLIVASGHSADAIAGAQLRIQGPAGWSALGTVSGSVPAAPDERELLAVPVPAGKYTGISLGDDVARVDIDVTAGQVEPVLIGIEGGRLIAGAAYAGNDQLNLGLGELAGKFVAMPAFALEDQDGKPFDNASAAGQDLVIAAFHTTCHQTCPLYTALFFQLQRRLPGGVRLVEVTTDPGTDTPAALHAYAQSIGAGWTFATGSADAVAAFWKPFGVALAAGDSHVSTLALVDRHGYVRLVYRGVPAVGHDLPPQLVTSLGAEGLQELASGGDGWGSAEVLKALLTITGPIEPATQTGGRAPAFSLTATDGGRVSLGSLAGKPLVINFWASYCPPCKAEMPMLQRVMAAQTSAQLVLVNEGDTTQAAANFLRAVGVSSRSLLDSDLAVGHAYGAIALPTTVFVATDGTVASRQVGQLDERVLDAELATLGH
jgi:cytochrome oxidase Cu insertion factor (SCO1/SenC/PrrC family)